MPKEFKNKEELVATLKNQLGTKAEMAIKAMLEIYKYQTEDEQLTQSTSHNNKVGFSGIDAQILSSFAEYYLSKQRLSEKQTAILLKKMPKYAGQLISRAIEKGLYVKNDNGNYVIA